MHAQRPLLAPCRCSKPAAPAGRANGRARARRDAELERILTIAARTPDHGKLFPWRFVTVGDDQRDALAALLHQALAEHDPRATPAQHREGRRVRAICAASWSCSSRRRSQGHKIPVWEQELSCGAAGMNLLLAAHALGYVAGWVTGWRAYSRTRPRRLLRRRASGSPASSSSASPARELEERPRAPLGDGRAAVGAAGA